MLFIRYLWTGEHQLTRNLLNNCTQKNILYKQDLIKQSGQHDLSTPTYCFFYNVTTWNSEETELGR